MADELNGRIVVVAKVKVLQEINKATNSESCVWKNDGAT